MTNENVHHGMTTTHNPTVGLRFVERKVPPLEQRVRILQQLFVPKNWETHDEEWRDVPLDEG